MNRRVLDGIQKRLRREQEYSKSVFVYDPMDNNNTDKRGGIAGDLLLQEQMFKETAKPTSMIRVSGTSNKSIMSSYHHPQRVSQQSLHSRTLPSESNLNTVASRMKMSNAAVEKRLLRDEQLVNETIQAKHELLEIKRKAAAESSKSQKGFYTLSAARESQKDKQNHLMCEALGESTDKSLRPKIRAFLGTNYKTDFFDSLDDFSGCVKALYTNSRALSWKFSRIADENNVEQLLHHPHARRLQSIHEMDEQVTHDIRASMSSLSSLPPQSVEIKNAQQLNRNETISIIAPKLKNLQKQQFQLGDIDSYSKDKLRHDQISHLYRTSGMQFENAQVGMLARESELKQQNEQFKSISSQLAQYREMFRQNLNTFKRGNRKTSMATNASEQGSTRHVEVVVVPGLLKPEVLAEGIAAAPNATPRTQEGIALPKREIPSEKEIKERFRKTVWVVIEKLKRLKLTFEELCLSNVFPFSPFEREGSSVFFSAVKQDKVDDVKKMLIHNRYYVFDFDYTKQTALHWCARRNHMEMLALICENGADLEAQDMGGRTALFLCVKNGFLDACRMLLARGASPRIRSLARNRPTDYTTNDVIKVMLRKAEQLHTMMDLVPIKRRKEFWIRNAVQVFSHHSSDKLNENIYKLKAADLQMN